MKVSVYTIARNEVANVAAWVAQLADADEVTVCDTGSSDGTDAQLTALGCRVYPIVVEPFRFDLARNTALALVAGDADLCVVVDLDERISDGWRKELERVWQPETQRVLVTCSAPVAAAGTITPLARPDRFTDNRRIHRRRGYLWKYPCHESLVWHGLGPDAVTDSAIHISQPPSTHQYLETLRQGYREYNYSPRATFYYGRELYNTGDYAGAAMVLERLMRFPRLELSITEEDYALAAIILASCYLELQLWPEALRWNELARGLITVESERAKLEEHQQLILRYRDNPQQLAD